MTVYIDRTGEPDDVFEREVLARVGDPVTAPQPATPGSDSVHEEIAEVLNREGAFCGQCGREPGDPINDCPDCARCLYSYAAALLPLVDRLRAEAKAEALEEMADRLAKNHDVGPARRCRNRAAAYRTNPSSEEQS